LLPVLTAQVYSQLRLYAERHRQVGDVALNHADLVKADITSVIEGVRQFGAVVVQFQSSQASNERCSEQMTAIRESLPRYRFLALFSPADGALVCASDGTPIAIRDAHPPWLANLMTARDLSVGQIVSEPEGRFLPIAVHLAAPGAGHEPRVLVAALNTAWLAKHLDSIGADRRTDTSPAALMISDRDGNIVVRVPDAPDLVGRPVPGWAHPLLGRPDQGVEAVTDPEGHAVLAAFVPVGSTSGLTIVNAVMVPDLAADIEQATYQDLLVIGGAALAALILAWVAGRRFIRQPTEALLQAARKWREGDLSARASLIDGGSEFTALGQSFNAMAAGLQARELERRMQASGLESQLAERTRELSEAANRLQVEIAGRGKTEAALHQAQKLQAVGQLAGGIAHDFNNMLATVLGNLELMERRVAQAGEDWASADSDRMLRLIERATGAVTRGAELTSRLLAFSRRKRLEPRSTDINALLTELITLANSTIGRRVQVVPEFADDLWPAMVDPSQVDSAILNLCLNARDAMPQGGRLTVQTANVTIPAGGGQYAGNKNLAPGGYVKVCIADNGVGMSPEVKARAFDLFFTTKNSSGGSGLGLSQVDAMVRQAGGSVSIDSTVGEGTCVTLLLPRAMSASEVAAAPTEDPVSLPMRSPGSELVLIVDDDNAVRQVTVEMVRDLGCEVAQASGGEQALALIEKLTPKLILLDYAMPGMNGLQLASALRERGVSAPIALVTGYAELSEADVSAARLAGLLRKPFTIRELNVLLMQLRAAAGAHQTLLESGLMER
jgi:signal transduction histidine kinase/CheY-like chemotaxis protein